MTPDRTVMEVASELQCSPKKVRRLAAAGTLPPVDGRDLRHGPAPDQALRDALEESLSRLAKGALLHA